MGLRKGLRYARDAVSAGIALRGFRPGIETTAADHLEGVVDLHSTRPALLCEGRTVTYGELDALANRVAHHFASLGVSPGDVVALDMENRPEFVATWFGLAKLGATTALINTNLSGVQLAHSLSVAAPRHVIVGAELEPQLQTVREDLPGDVTVWGQGGDVEGARDLDAAIDVASPRRPSPSLRAGLTLGGTDLFYIYTSGTTGMPKAVRLSNLRFVMGAVGAAHQMRLTPADREYICLPLYHSAAGVGAIGATLTSGASAVLVRKFSASRFWSDVVTHEATAFQYIGELLRYLVNQPPVSEERQHQIRVAMGNGLRPEIWTEVQERFRIPEIIEFYGSTEGNVGFMNVDGTPGSIGWMPRWVRKASGISIICFDVEAGDVHRGPDGFCVEVGPGEAGEAIGRIPKKKTRAIGRFEGYSDEAATERKILRDVFRKGDAYFRTGDLLRFDEDDNFYFVDRIGDTFRWKGENVATTEVAEVISTIPGVAEANVYGVTVPGADGRAGMVAVVPEGAGLDLDLVKLYEITERDLAPYARPLFVRVQPAIEITATFKHRKVDLVAEGFDPAVVEDPLYVRDADSRSYAPLDGDRYQAICDGRVRL